MQDKLNNNSITKTIPTTTAHKTAYRTVHRTALKTAMSVPTTQKALQINTVGGPEVLELNPSAPVPTITADQILVKNTHAGVNYIDTVPPLPAPIAPEEVLMRTGLPRGHLPAAVLPLHAGPRRRGPRGGRRRQGQPGRL